MRRLFVGIPPTAEAAAALQEVCRKFQAGSGTAEEGLRWAGPGSWHITLQFLGAASEAQYGCLVPALRQAPSPPVPVRATELGVFDRAGIFLVAIAPSPELVALERLVTAATEPCGFAAEGRPYRPHITLARAKGSRGRQALRQWKREQERQGREGATAAALRKCVFEASEFLLYESFTGGSSSRYEVRARFSLDAA